MGNWQPICYYCSVSYRISLPPCPPATRPSLPQPNFCSSAFRMRPVAQATDLRFLQDMAPPTSPLLLLFVFFQVLPAFCYNPPQPPRPPPPACLTLWPPASANLQAVSDLGASGMSPWTSCISNNNFLDTSAHWIWNSAGAARSAPAGEAINFYSVVFVTSATPVQAKVQFIVDDFGYLFVKKQKQKQIFGISRRGRGVTHPFSWRLSKYAYSQYRIP